jgi:hypothetical protein
MLCEADEEAALLSNAAMQADFPTVESRCLQTGPVSIVAEGPSGRFACAPALGELLRNERFVDIACTPSPPICLDAVDR